jgi:hypothetical protein
MIQSIVKSVVDVMNSGGDSFSFGHTQKAIQNLQSDEADLPIVFLDMPVTFNPVVTDTGFIKNVFKCSLVILYKSNMDDSGGFNNSTETIAEQEQIAIFEKAFAAQRQFMLLLNKSVEVKDYSYNGSAFQVQHVFDCDLSGIAWSVDIEPKDYAGVCTDGLFPVPNCPTSSYLIEDTDGTILYNGTLAAGQSLNTIIQNSTAVLKNTLGTTLSTTEILAEGSEDIIAPGALVGVLNSEGTTVDGDSFASGTSGNLLAPDGTVNNSDGTLITTVPSNAVAVAPDITVTDSDGTSSAYPSGKDFVCKPSAPCDPVYNLVDFFTLDINNPFGNTNRFTDELGAQIYANNIMIDWFTQKEGNVTANETTYSANGINKAAAAAYCAALTHGGFTGWRLGEWTEWVNILYPLGTRMLNYAPINLADNSRFWTNTSTLGGTQSFTAGINVGVGISAIGDTWPGGRGLAFRTFTLSELGL